MADNEGEMTSMAIACTSNNEFLRQGRQWVDAEMLKGRNATLLSFGQGNFGAGAEAIRTLRPERIAVFCHGWTRRLQTGHEGVEGAYGLALLLNYPELIGATFYTCSAAKRDGFLHTTGAILRSMGRRPLIVGHTTSGHTTRNPKVAVIFGTEWTPVPQSHEWRLRCRSEERFDFLEKGFGWPM